MRKTLESKSLRHRPAPSLKQEKNTVIQARHTLDFLFSRNQHDSALTQARKTYSQGHNCLGNWRSAVGISQYTGKKPQGAIFQRSSDHLNRK